MTHAATRRLAFGGIAAAACWMFVPCRALAQVVLRGADQPLAESVRVVAPEGVHVDAGGGVVIVGLDLIREVRGEQGAAFAELQPLANQLWRARTRLARGDVDGAEPLFESVMTLLQTRDAPPGPTTAVASEGLLRCRLSRGARAGAVRAWLDHLTSSGTPEDRASWRMGVIDAAPAIDPAHGVAPALPPIWLAGQVSAEHLSAELAETSLKAPSALVRELARLYLAAGAFESAEPVATAGLQHSPEHAGLRLVRDVVMARVGDGQQRESARSALRARVSDPGVEPWVEAWCRVAIGRSLLRSGDPGDRRRGVIEMLHVPARLSADAPGLAALALAQSAVVLHEQGDAEGAAALRAELRRLWPADPSSRWAPLEEVRSPAAASSEGDGA